VVAIILLLAAILLPALNQARRAAKRTICINNVRQIGLAMQCYVDEHNGWYPRSWFDASEPSGSPPHSYDFVGIAGVSFWTAPPDKRVLNRCLGIKGDATNLATSAAINVTRCPFDTGTPNWQSWRTVGTSYTFYDRTYEEIEQGRYVIFEGAWAIEGHRQSEVSSPERKMCLADIVVQASGNLYGWHDSAVPQSPSEVSMNFVDGHTAFVKRRYGPDDFFNHNATVAQIEALILVLCNSAAFTIFRRRSR